MKNITLSADEHLIATARIEAQSRGTTLNQLFRDWLEGIANRKNRAQSAEASALLDKLGKQLQFARKFTREELNER